MPNLRTLLPLATLLSLFGATTALAAPTVQLDPQPTPVVTRVDSSGNPYGCPERSSASQSCIVDGATQGIGFHDCLASTSLRFSVSMTGVPDPSYGLQIWAGTTDCTQPGATNNTTTATCWKVAADPIPAVLIAPLDIRVADVVSGLGTTPPAQTYTAADATTACNHAKSASTGVTTVTLYFMVFPSGANGAPVSSASYPVKVKLDGPAAVSGLTASAGDGEIVLGWTPPPTDPTLQGFDLFAVTQGTTLGDGGAATCNGTSGTVDVSSIACPTTSGPALCQLVLGPTATTGSVSGLTGNTTYVAAVAAIDEYGNEGPVAQAACATPTLADGGTTTSGSGGCSCDAAGADSRFGIGLASLGLAALAVVATRLRNRRRRL